jgi:predicted amidohydrolase YtcJ
MALAADVVFIDGQVITLNPVKPIVQAFALRDGRFVTVGRNEQALSVAGPQTRRVSLGGKTVVPGFCDSHIHLISYGMGLLREADLVGSESIEDVLSRLSEVAHRTSGWIQGFGFDQDKLREKRFPTRAELDSVSTTRPILIWRVCGHALVVNSAAIALATEQERRAGNADTGLYTETAADAFYRYVPAPTTDEMEQAALLASRAALRTGITSVQTLLDTPQQMQAYSRLKRKGKLPIRIVGMPPYSAVQALHHHGINSTFGDDFLRVGACKLFSDGSLGAQTAWLSAPYSDKPETRGIRIYEPDDLKRKCADAQAKGFQLAIHAIGDQAVREVIDAIEFALAGEDNVLDRHRIEHASMCPPDCLERMAAKKIVATLQPQFVTSDTWTEKRVGPSRVPWCYPFKSMIDAGVPVTISSDCPVERLDAFAALSSAVGGHPWRPGQTLSFDEALRAYCLGSAYAAHMDEQLGSIEEGKLADFVVLSGDPTTMSAEQIRQLRADAVHIGGTEVARDA